MIRNTLFRWLAHASGLRARDLSNTANLHFTNMKQNLRSYVQAAALLALLSTSTRAPGQLSANQQPINSPANPMESTTRRQLNVEQRKFENYISDGENELGNAEYRYTLPQYALAENNIILATLNLDVTFALMAGHPGRIGALHTSIFFNEGQLVRNFQMNYEALRTRAYDLQNRINYFVRYKLGPTGYTNAIAAYLNNWSDQIRNSLNPEERAREVYRQVEKAQSQQRGVTPGEINSAAAGPGGTQRQDLGSGFTFDPNTGTIRDSGGNVIPGATWDPSRHRIKMGPYSFDPRNPNMVYDDQGNLVPNMRYNPQTGQLEQFDPSTGTWTPVSPSGRESTSNFQRGSPTAGGSTRQSPGNDYSSGPAPSDTIMTADGRRLGWEEFKTYLDPATGKIKPDVVRIKYSDHQGGQITSETRYSVKLEKGNGPRDWVLNEKPVDTLDWQFLIRPVGDQRKVTDGFQATYELVNDASASADFDVTGWEGPDGTVYRTNNKQFTLTFAQPEQQTIVAHGVTKKYNNQFAISLVTR